MNYKKYNTSMKFVSYVSGFFLLLGLSMVSMVSVVYGVEYEVWNNTDGLSTGGTKFPNPFGGTPYTDSLYGFVYFVLTNIVFPMGSIVVVFFIIYAGYLFATALGSEDKLKKAKETFLGVVIGTVILLGSWAIASAIKGTLCQISGGNIPELCNPI